MFEYRNAQRLTEEEIVVLLLDNLELLRFGLCYQVNDMKDNGIIDDSEALDINEWLDEYLPAYQYPSLFNDECPLYCFPLDDHDSRYYWLKHQLNRIKNGK